MAFLPLLTLIVLLALESHQQLPMTSTPLANDGSVTVSAPSHWTSDTISVISQDVLLRDTQRPPSSRRSWWSKIWGKDGAKKKYRPLLLDTIATVRHDLDEQGMFNEGAAATGGTTVAKFSRDEIETGSSLPSTHHLDTKHGTKPPSFQIFEVKGFFNAEQYLVNPNDTAGFTDSMLDFSNSNSNNQNSVLIIRVGTTLTASQLHNNNDNSSSKTTFSACLEEHNNSSSYTRPGVVLFNLPPARNKVVEVVGK